MGEARVDDLYSDFGPPVGLAEEEVRASLSGGSAGWPPHGIQRISGDDRCSIRSPPAAQELGHGGGGGAEPMAAEGAAC